MGSDTTDILALIDQDNSKALEQMRKTNGDGCKAHPAIVDGMERQMFLQTLTYKKTVDIGHAVENLNGHKQLKSGKTMFKKLKVGPVSIEGFDVRDIGRIIVMIGLGYIFLYMHGWLPWL
jgi:hypothetical protein